MQASDIQVMIAGLTYAITTKDLETPFGECLPGDRKVRIFRGETMRGGIPFIRVERPEDGNSHLIAVQDLETVHLVGRA